VHTYTAGEGYQTHFSVSGLNPTSVLSLLTQGRERPASSHLVIGVVTDNKDPKGWGRVKVKYPWLTSDHASDWARVVSVGGGPERGIEFLPEVNDEVLVGFELGDIHHPYVLGGLWNGKDAPPEKSDKVVSGGKVQKRIIRSRAGHVITLDDSDGKENITIQDKGGNTIVIDSSKNELTIEMKGNTTISTKGDTTISSKGKMTLEAKGKLEMKGMGVVVDGGAATVDVKGTVVNLN
jgi:uncharacterized protein involved in type VI secretion and phage assembly